MRRLIGIAAAGTAAIATLAVVPMAPSSAAVAKAGAACKKVGQKSGNLVCTKVGKKLVYRAAPAPTTIAPVTTAAAGGAAPVTTAAPAAGPNPVNVQPNAKKGGTVVYMSGEIGSLDPLRIPGGGTAGFDHAVAIFNTLMKVTKSGDVIPEMAQSLTSADNGKTWTLKLRPGIKFTDGTDYNADAVIFNFKRYLDPKNNYPFISHISDVRDMKAVDPLTVEFTLAKPIGSFPIALADNSGMIGSPKAIAADATAFGQKPVGAGPFMFKEWVRDDHMDLVKNPNYWNASRVYLDGIRYRAVPDGAARAQALLTGQADVVYSLIDTQLLLRGNKGTQIWGGVSDGGYFLQPNVSRGAFKDPRVRKAVALAIDYSKVNKALYNGIWREEKLDCPPFTKEQPECVPGLYPDPNIDQAKQLIAQYKAEGNSVDVDYLIGTVFQPQGDFMTQVMQSVGLNPKVRTLTGADWLVAINAGQWDAAIYARSAFPTAFPYLNAFFEINGRNLPKHNDASWDAAMKQGSDAPTTAQRVDGWKNFQKIMAQNNYVIWLGPWYGGFTLKDSVQPGDQVFTENVRLAEFYFTN